MRKKLYGNAVTPTCSVCKNGRPSTDGQVILCLCRGVVEPAARCRKFEYDPLRRVPYVQPPLATHSQEEFTLE